MCSDTNNLTAYVMQLVEDISGVRPLTDETPVDMTSLQQVEFAMELEEKYQVVINEEPEWQTVKEVVEWLRKRL